MRNTCAGCDLGFPKVLNLMKGILAGFVTSLKSRRKWWRLPKGPGESRGARSRIGVGIQIVKWSGGWPFDTRE